MAQDIYTKQPIRIDSREHVLLNALGGRLEVRGIIDERTNSRFGGTIDAALEKGLQAARLVLDAPSGRGDPPAKLTGLVADGRKFDVAPGGVIYPQPEKRLLEWAEDGRNLSLDVTVPNERALRNMLRNGARERRRDLDGLMATLRPMLRTRRDVPPQLPFVMNIWADAPYRATAKMACNLIAHGHADTFRHEHFDEIRTFVLDGVTPAVLPVQAADIHAAHGGLGPLDHLIRVGISPARDVVGLVVYFGFLAFVVRLGTAPDDLQVERAYRVDQLGRRHRLDDPADLAIAIPSFEEAASRSFEDFRDVAVRQMHAFVPAALDYQKGLWLRRIIVRHGHVLERDVAPGHRPTDAQRWAFARAVADEVVADPAPHAARGGGADGHGRSPTHV